MLIEMLLGYSICCIISSIFVAMSGRDTVDLIGQCIMSCAVYTLIYLVFLQ